MTSAFDYQGLQKAIEKKRQKAATFYRVDLHVHTIGSPPSDHPSTHDKPGFVSKVPEDEAGLRATPEKFKQRFIEAAKAKRLKIVAVTDHNESDMAEELSALSDSELVILPGIEVSVQTGLFEDSTVHVLGIFPQGTSSKTIDKIFPPGCGMPESGKRDISSRTQTPIGDLIDLIHDLGGICIAAHVSSDKGMRTIFRMQDRKYLEARFLHKYLTKKAKSGKLTQSEQEELQRLKRQLAELPNDMQNAYLTFLADHNFDAIQVKNWKEEEHYKGEHTEALDLPPFVCIVASDAHTLADLGCEGHCTYIKLTEASLDGIKKAFRDPDARIRYDTTIPSHRCSRILGISFEGGSFDGETLGFSDNLTTLIGGRGTGKSATIEALRFLFQQPITDLPDRLQDDIRERLEYTLRDATVKALFEDSSGEVYVLKRRLGESKTAVFSLDGQPQPAIELPESQKVRAEIYGWSEIETLSDSPRKQLRLLDRYVPGVEKLKQAVAEQLMELKANGERMVRLAQEIQNLLPLVANAAEIDAELRRLSSPELDAAFKEFDANNQASLGLTQLLKAVTEVGEKLLVDKKKIEFAAHFSTALDNHREKLAPYDWWQETEEALREQSARAQKLYEELLGVLSSMQEQIAGAQKKLDAERIQIEARLNALAEQSGAQDFRSALSKRQELSEKAAEIKNAQADIDAKYGEFRRLLEIRRTRILPALQEARKALYDARAKKAQSIAAKLANLSTANKVGIKLIRLGDREAFARALGHKVGTRTSGLLKKVDQQYLRKDYPGYYSTRFTPHEFVSLFLDDVENADTLAIRYIRISDGVDRGKIVRLVEGEVREENGFLVERDHSGNVVGKWPSKNHELVLVEDTERIWQHLSPVYYDGEIHKYPNPEKLEKLLKLELCDIEDKPEITLDGRPIEGLSPGQRCSALIPIVLVEGDVPLIIDQPEDNLDNKLVFDLVVDILRRLKERRQVIVATHNPNIPVSGDAEQVIVFDSPSKDRCCAVEQGSIDDDAIVHHIKTIMEGGDKAFEMRAKKYGLRRI